jgi:hypothetical protein
VSISVDHVFFPQAGGPGEWLPPWRVAVAWDLPLTTADAESVRRGAATC